MVGVGSGFTVTVMVVVLAHCPDDGVNVYTVVAWVFIVGDQVPEMPLVEVVGSENVPLKQIAGICVKAGLIGTL
jgi:hypothetical protein